MRTNDSKTSVDSKLEEMEEKYPVEQIAVKNEKKITAKDVKEAVKEINPDTDSLGSRGWIHPLSFMIVLEVNLFKKRFLLKIIKNIIASILLKRREKL